jgi:hypothetical protein
MSKHFQLLHEDFEKGRINCKIMVSAGIIALLDTIEQYLKDSNQTEPMPVVISCSGLLTTARQEQICAGEQQSR